MARYKLTHDYANNQFFGRAGDVVALDDDEHERLERDSPGTFEAVPGDAGDVAVEDLTAADVLTEHGAAVLDELQAQTPTLDIDPEDKAKEIPGEGNKYTPASGYNPAPQGARVVERAPADRQKKGAAKRSDEADAGATSADTSASARVTAEPTPASAAADAAQLAGGVTAHEDDEDDAKKKTAKQAEADKAAAANKGEITAADFKATKKG